MEEKEIEKMVKEIIRFLKKKQMWKVDVAVYANGQRHNPEGTTASDKEFPGVAYMWFEGPLNYAINHGLKDPQYKIFNGLKDIFANHGCDYGWGNHTTLNIYQKPEVSNEHNN